MELDVKKSHTDFRDYTCITVSDEHAIKADKRGQFKKWVTPQACESIKKCIQFGRNDDS